jgi:tetratricopeptide (TPR) repeat protein
MHAEFRHAQRLHEAGCLTEALDVYQRLSLGNPLHAELMHFSGLARYQLGNQEFGLRDIRKSISLSPSVAVFWSNLAKTLSECGKRAQAILLCTRALAIEGAHRDAAFNRANLLRLEGELFESVRRYREAISSNPADFDIYLNLGVCERQRGRNFDAVEAYRRCLLIKPGDADAEFSMALSMLSVGNFQHGWRAYRSRFHAKVNEAHGRVTAAVRRSKPAYSGNPNTRLLVWGEQGVGDEIMFGSLIQELRSQGTELLLQVDPRLKALYQRAYPGVRLFDRSALVDVDQYDEQIAIGDLAGYLRDSLESFTRQPQHYLRENQVLRDRYRRRMKLKPSEIVVGLSWHSIAPETGAQRSLSLTTVLNAMSTVPNVRFVNLQYGDVTEEVRRSAVETGISLWEEPEVDNRQDLNGLSALIAACDLVVTIGNTTAHLAGALGKRTLVLLPVVAGWRWMEAGETCLWYASLTLLRQSHAGEWGSVLERVRREVSDCAVRSVANQSAILNS